MTTQTEALKLALEALVQERTNYEDWDKEDGAPEYIYGAINAIERALAQPEQEPTWYHAECDDPDHSGFFKEAIDAVTQVNEHGGFVTQLCTTPPQRKPWVSLSDEDIERIAKKARSKDHAITLAMREFKEKNT